MSLVHRLSRLLAPLVAGVLLVSGCAAGGGPAPRYYLLNPAPAPAGAASTALTVKLLELRLPPYLERPQIVTRSASNQLELAEYHQWGGNLRHNIQSVMVTNLARALGTPRVSGPPHRTGLAADFLLEVEISAFERGPDGRVELTAWWRLQRGADRETVAVRVSELVSPPLSPEAGFAATVEAMSGQLAALGREIAAAILRQGTGSDGG